MSAYPPLVITGNRIDPLGALKATGVRLTSFLVPASREKCQTMLDAMFSTPSGGKVRYRMLGSNVMLGAAEISRIHATDPVEQHEGWADEIDFGLWVPALREGDGLFAIRMIPLYLFVDVAAAMAGGREIWGFPKQTGQFDFTPQTSDPAAARTFRAKGYALKTFAPSTQAGWAEIAHVSPILESPVRGPLADLERFARQFFEGLADGAADVAGKLSTAFGLGHVTMAFLKQFPDVADPSRACYQAITEARSRVVGFRGSGLTHNHYTIAISSYASLPIAAELGIPEGPQKVGQGIWVDFDFTMDLGTEIWRATGT
jgi:Acetoacetate decarboxylase (ADC)